MDAIKINMRDKIFNTTELDVLSISEVDGMLLITFNELINHKIGIGQEMMFRRYIFDSDDVCTMLESVINVVGKTTTIFNGKKYDSIYATLPANREMRLNTWIADKISLKATSGECESDLDSYFDEGLNHLLVKNGDYYDIQDWIHYFHYTDLDDVEHEYFVVSFYESHDIFAQDIEQLESDTGKKYIIDVLDANGEKIGEIKGLKIPKIGSLLEATSADTLDCKKIGTCGILGIDGGLYEPVECKYVHTPFEFSRNMIMFSSASTIFDEEESPLFDSVTNILAHGKTFVPRYNPFYYYYMEDGWKKCKMWQDRWWAEYKSKNELEPRYQYYVNSGDSKTVFCMVSDYWKVPMLKLTADNFDMGIEDNMYSYVDRVIDEQIPAVIDMERFKYRPVIFEEAAEDGAKDSATTVDSIMIDLHFRKRKEKKMVKSRAAQGGKYPIYDEGWHLDDESGSTIWWNGYDYSGYTFDEQTFSEYIEQSGHTSDLLGYLDFDDDDVYYRKSKIEKTFIRLSFYTSKDPLEQKMLYYSTIFLDPTSLYGRFMKQYLYKYEKYGEMDSTPLVFMSETSSSAVLDTEIVVHGESYTMASSEGFNIYLFADDADKVDEGKDYRTIYMKVEFNHAGNGKTIPMLMWPKNEDDGKYRQLTAQTFLQDLYIEVRIKHLNDGRYVYWFPNGEIDGNGIRLVLFEPKLDIEETI